MAGSVPLRLPTRFLEKVWGATDLAPFFESSGRKIGEVWFEADLPLLIKFIFTTEALSVQVHPGDAFAAAHEKSLGKTEMWYVLRADPGAKIALGFKETLTRAQLLESVQTGEIEKLLRWIEVKPGDVFFTPAGTVHAIGAGLAMCEIQQNSDITYRLYDYGRPRELHVEKALQVTDTHASSEGPVALPLTSEYFHTELMVLAAQTDYVTDVSRFHVLIILSGTGSLAGQSFRLGEAWLIPPGTDSFSIAPSGPVQILRTWVP